MAEFVVADAPYKVYPGGVIALRCSDWLGAARGTLSTESDARSVTGTVVRDSQKVTTSIFDTDRLDIEPSAYQEADDTLEIDMSQITGLELSNFPYRVLVSYLIEGDWDSTNSDTTRGGSQELFAYACWLASHGSVSRPDTNPMDYVHYMCRGVDSYRYVGGGPINFSTGSEVLRFRSYSQSGTTIEWLLDQIILLPYITGSAVGDWTSADFDIVGGQQGVSESVYALDPDDVPADWPEAWIDGADGGDANGKFTWMPFPYTEPTGFELDGGGDYQKDDAEYMVRVVGDLNDDTEWSDFRFLENSENPSQQNIASHCYGLHGPLYVPPQVWVAEDFARDTGGDHVYGANDQHFEDHEWGTSPEGFFWRSNGPTGPTFSPPDGHDHGSAMYCDSSGRGVLAWRFGTDAIVPVGAVLTVSAGGAIITGGDEGGAGVNADNIRIVGSFHIENTESPDSMPLLPQLFEITTADKVFGTGLSSRNGVSFILDMRTGNYIFGTADLILDNIAGSISDADNLLTGPAALPSWAYDTRYGFRIELHRYIVRFKVWRYADGEPGAWTLEGEMPLRRFDPAREPYDYDDDLHFSIEEGFNTGGPHTLCFRNGGSNHRQAGSYATYIYNDLEISYDPVGDNESAWASIERPEGTEVGRIEMPSGCQHLVYWGNRIWSPYFAAMGGNLLDFSAKVWNDADAAELQRAEAVWFWFRTTRGGIVSMNWNSATSADITRIHS